MLSIFQNFRLVFAQNRFSLLSISQLFEDDGERMATSIQPPVIVGGTLIDERRSRFTVYSSEDKRKPLMIFSPGNFNVARVSSGRDIVLVIAVFDIKKQNFVMLKFLMRFEYELLAEGFYRHVTRAAPCTDSSISVDIADTFIAP